MPESPPDGPQRPEIRTMSRRATRLFVIIAIVVVVVAAFASAYIFSRAARDPEVQRRAQEIRQQMETAADSAAAATTDASPRIDDGP
jgi:flagellar biosynthesis/type III secretory pathway M-ring protein FliF/YscJ